MSDETKASRVEPREWKERVEIIREGHALERRDYPESTTDGVDDIDFLLSVVDSQEREIEHLRKQVTKFQMEGQWSEYEAHQRTKSAFDEAIKERDQLRKDLAAMREEVTKLEGKLATYRGEFK